MFKDKSNTNDIIYFNSFEELEDKLYNYLQKIYNNQENDIKKSEKQKQFKQSEQNNLINENLKSLDSEQSEQSEQSEHSEQSEQSEHSEHSEQSKHSEQTKKSIKPIRIKQVKQIKPIKLGDQPINVKTVKEQKINLTAKENKIYELQHYKKSNIQEIEMLKNKIDKLERLNKKIDDEILELSKKNPLEEFYDYVKDISLKYEIDLTNLINQFKILYDELNKNNIQLNIDKINDKFTLMIEGTEFSDVQKFKIQKLKKLFKSLNM